MTKIWVVKHALSSKGIFEIDAEIEPNGFVSYAGRKGRKSYPHVEVGDLIEVEYERSIVHFRITEVRYEFDPRDQFFGKCEIFRVVSKADGKVVYMRLDVPNGIARRAMAAIAAWIGGRAA